jgi:hypothetical protein
MKAFLWCAKEEVQGGGEMLGGMEWSSVTFGLRRAWCSRHGSL